MAGVLLVVAALPQMHHPARAAVGDLRLTRNVPAAARCTSTGIGTSVTIVPGTMVNRSEPILLVVSCFVREGSGSTEHRNLYFVNPATDPATLVLTIATTNTPPEGWGSLSLRGDKGDLLGCGNARNGTHAVHSIDISPFNATPDGTSTFLFNAQPGFDICDGVAWDTADNTIFQSPDVSGTVYHYSQTGALLGSFPAACSSNSGVAVGGASLFEACNGSIVIHQVNKSTGVSIRSFPSGGTRTEDLECDPVTLAASNVDLIWSKDAFDNELFGFEIPDGTCGFAGGPPVTPPRCLDTDGNANPDNDGDGLCDNWETTGIDSNDDGVVDLRLYDVNGDGTVQASEAARINHKDIYLEIDFMAQHQPDVNAVNDVIASFAASPVANPDATTGIRLHVQVNEQAVAHNNNLAFEPCTGGAPAGTPDFDTVKNASFGTAGERAGGVTVTNAKRFAFHYDLWVHNLLGLGGTSGCAELPGNDFVVSLGSWTAVGGHPVGTRNEQAGTLMHEFGHNLNLRHGGSDNVNCKPNYLSVMSYSRQIAGMPIAGRPLDYSQASLGALNEANLSEPAGIGGPAGNQTAFGPPPVTVVPSNGAINWNRDTDSTDVGVAADVNNMGPGTGCDGSGAALAGYNDWNSLKYDFQNTTDFADGVHLSMLEVDEITVDEARRLAGPEPACPAGGAVISGTPGDDVIMGTPGADVILGLGGNDKINGLGGADVICAGDGDDQVLAGDGDDQVFGDAGNDRLSGDAGNDTLIDVSGNDQLTGGDGDDTLKTADESGGDFLAGGGQVTTDTCVADAADSLAGCSP